MRDSIFYSAMRALFVAFCVIIGIGLGILAWSILAGALSTTVDTRLKTVNTEEIMPNAEGVREVTRSAPAILQINIDGIIGTEDLSANSVRQQLIESREGNFKLNTIKGILLYINTPGGTVFDADGMYNAIKDYKKRYEVPVYAYIDGLCASGGMYVAAAADKIFASDVSLIGSVGVIAPTFVNVTKTLEKLGVETLTISAGKGKDALNPLRPWKPDEEKDYKNLIEYYYQHFLNIVTTNRPKITREKLVEDYGAHLFPAPEAVEHGFIDETVVSIADAIRELTQKAGIEQNYQVIRLTNRNWWSDMFSVQSPLLTGKIKHQFDLTPRLEPALQNQYLYMYQP